MNTCNVVINIVRDPLRNDVCHHVPSHIEGDLRHPLIVSSYALHHFGVKGKELPANMTVLGLQFRLLDYDFMRDEAAYLCVTPWPFRWMLLRSAVIISRASKYVYWRFIMTLHIWGLAYVPQSDVPSWRHIGKSRN